MRWGGGGEKKLKELRYEMGGGGVGVERGGGEW